MTAEAIATRPTQRRWWRDPRRLPWWRIPLYPASFLCSMVLLTWGETGIDPHLLVRPLAVAAGVSLGLTLALAWVFHDRDRAALAASALAVAVLTLDDRAALMLVLATVLIVVEGILHRGRPAIVAGIATRLMSIVGAVLLIASALVLVQGGAVARAISDVTRAALPPPGPIEAGRPDVYLFLLDGYPGDRAATHATAFDAGAFPDALEERGFDVVGDSRSNYLLTPLTLASMLSMRHIVDIPAIDPPFISRSDDWYRARHVIEDSPVIDAFRAGGYDTMVVDGGYGHAQLRRVDRFIAHPGPEELELVLMKYSRVGRIIEAIAPGTLAEAARRRIEDTLQTASSLAAEPHERPRFVIVHVPAPHPPWVFEADGLPRDPTVLAFGGEPGLSEQEALDAGFAQATHVAGLTTQAIDAIDAAAAGEPVIVVMSDHGPKGGTGTVEDLWFDVEVRASNFMAARTPGHPGLFTSARPTPVNLFPTLFGAYLGIHVDRQPDSVWAWRDSYLDAVEVPPITGWTR